MAREVTFDLQSDEGVPPLELDETRGRGPAFVTGATAAHVIGAATVDAPERAACAYCGASGWAIYGARAACAQCGAPVPVALPAEARRSRYASPMPSFATPAWGPAQPAWGPAPTAAGAPAWAPARTDDVFDALASVPFAFWKRLPVYAFLTLLLGNGCRCGGLSGWTNGGLAALIVLGVIGAVVSLQRSP
jgi:hypothetical protein